MIFKKIEKQQAIILIITSFNQLNNFLSFFKEKKFIDKKKFYLVLFSETIPEQLILHLYKQIKKYTSVEIIDLRPKSFYSKKRILNLEFLKFFFYYIFVFKIIFLIKKSSLISFIVTYSKIQFTTLFFMIFMSPSKFFLLEDGIGDYLPRKKKLKTLIIYFFLKILFSYKKHQIYVLQLAKSKDDYTGLFNEKFLKKINFINNKKLYLNFLEKTSKKELTLKPKCIIIGTKHLPHTFDYYKDLYIKTIDKIKKEFPYKREEILFFTHPRDELFYIEELEKVLTNDSLVKNVSSIVVENYLSQNNLEIVIGTFSSSLYYAKSIFDKKHVYYIENYETLDETNITKHNIDSILNSLNIKKIFNNKIKYEIKR